MLLWFQPQTIMTISGGIIFLISRTPSPNVPKVSDGESIKDVTESRAAEQHVAKTTLSAVLQFCAHSLSEEAYHRNGSNLPAVCRVGRVLQTHTFLHLCSTFYNGVL